MIAYKVTAHNNSWFVCLAKTAIHARRAGILEWGRGFTKTVEIASPDDCIEYQRNHMILTPEDF